MLSAAGLRESRSEDARAIGATTRPSPPEREPASAAGLAARSAAGVTGEKAVADPSSATASSDLASMMFFNASVTVAMQFFFVFPYYLARFRPSQRFPNCHRIRNGGLSGGSFFGAAARGRGGRQQRA
jgi:hypothetical protein